MVSTLTHWYRGDSEPFSMLATGLFTTSFVIFQIQGLIALFGLLWATDSVWKAFVAILLSIPFLLQPDFRFPIDLKSLPSSGRHSLIFQARHRIAPRL
jgi:hypothetical protein